jgi:hypothetical protein
MEQKKWKNKIKKACRNAGTYQPYFDHVIDSLASILEKRDEAEAQYIESGSLPVVEYTNKGGATNMSKNPALVLWDELNKSALAYWRDLGLTPAGLKKLNEDALKEKQAGFSDLLKDIGC